MCVSSLPEHFILVWSLWWASLYYLFNSCLSSHGISTYYLQTEWYNSSQLMLLFLLSCRFVIWYVYVWVGSGCASEFVCLTLLWCFQNWKLFDFCKSTDKGRASFTSHSIEGCCILHTLTLRLLMSYIYMELLVKPEMLTSYIYGPTFGNAETVSFYFLHNVSTLNQCREVSCVTFVCKHFAS